ASEHLRILPLDVRCDESVRRAVEAAGPIDVLVNNAGVGWLNALEGTPMDIARDIFETNTIGTMRTMQAVLPQFRERRSGTIVNVTSTVTVKPLPL
ncbi:SDR family NAD(P)-dependent oxidoreductase, partial [Aurantimonas coralicida]